MISRLQWQWTYAVLVVCAVGCSSGKSATRPDSQSASSSDWKQLHADRQSNEQVTEYDTNHDGKPDIWQYTVKAKSADGKEYNRLVRKELDLNGDGKVDIVRYYGEEGQLEKEALDLDFDGKVDQWNYYQNGVIVRKEIQRFLLQLPFFTVVADDIH